MVKRHGLHPHCYADDTQIYGFSDPSDVDALQERLSVSIDEVFSWMMSNRLQLNPAKTKALDVSIRSRLILLVLVTHRCCRYEQFEIWGPYTEADVTVSAHVTAIVKACFAALRQIRSRRRSLTRTALLTLVHALVVTKVVYCSSVLSGISRQLLQRLQSCLQRRRSSRVLARTLSWPTATYLDGHVPAAVRLYCRCAVRRVTGSQR